jgi:hypothetical protein
MASIRTVLLLTGILLLLVFWGPLTSFAEDLGPVYRKPHPSVTPRWNRLSWRDDRAVLLRTGGPGLAIQVEVTA